MFGGGSKNSEDKMDSPPMSRLFIICPKTCEEEDLRSHFDKYGTIEDIFVVKDKNSGDNKGIAYIKYARTTEAARALEEMDGQSLDENSRPMKVLIAASRNAQTPRSENDKEKYIRLFVVVAKTQNEDDLRDEFSKYGDLDDVNIVKDRNSKESKGLAYIKYKRFSHAAEAFENCPLKYKAVFAEPKSNSIKKDVDRRGSSNRNFMDDDDYRGGYGNFGRSSGNMGQDNGRFDKLMNQSEFDLSNFRRMQNSIKQPASLEVIASNLVNQDQLWRLFDIIPGLDYCHITRERGPRANEITVVYTSQEAATYAKDKLHGLEYPPGERLIVKVLGSNADNDPKFGNYKSVKDSLCSVALGPMKPMVSSDSDCLKRCFIVISSSLPISILKNVFCTFGGLIDIYLLPNKNCGYAKYSTEKSAQNAIDTLNGAEICGVRIKVMEAEEQTNAPKRQRMS